MGVWYAGIAARPYIAHGNTTIAAVAAPPSHFGVVRVIAEEIGIATHDKITSERFTQQV